MANTVGGPDAAEASEVAADVAILFQLSTLHAKQVRLTRERDSLLGALADRLKGVERLATDLETERRRLPVETSLDGEPRGLGRLRTFLYERKHGFGRTRTDLDELLRDLMPRIDEMASEVAFARQASDRLASALSTAASRVYASLSRSRRLPFAVRLKGDCCGGCNLRLPSSLLGEIRRIPRLYRCPSCNRVVCTDTATP